jgi:hypothetical protein
MLNIYALDVLSSFNYVEYQWCYEMMHEWKVLNRFKVSECVLQLGFKLCKEEWWNFMLIGLSYLKKAWFAKNRSIEFEL